MGLSKDLAPTDIEEGMRIGCRRPDQIGSNLEIVLPLPPKFEAAITCMTVDQKPNVTYKDLGGLD